METSDGIITWLIVNLANLLELAVEIIIISAILKSAKYLASIYKEVAEMNRLLKRQDYDYRQALENQ